MVFAGERTEVHVTLERVGHKSRNQFQGMDFQHFAPVRPPPRPFRPDYLVQHVPHEDPQPPASLWCEQDGRQAPHAESRQAAARLSYATNLARAGVSLAQTAALMRHGDPKLTQQVYTRLRIEDGHAAVAKIDGGWGTSTQRAREGR